MIPKQNNTTQNNNLPPSPPPGKKSNKVIFIVAVVVVLLLIVVGGYFLIKSIAKDKVVTNDNLTNVSSDDNKIASLNFDLAGPAAFQSDIEDINAEPNIPFDQPKLNELANLDDFNKIDKITFSTSQKDALETNGFFLTGNNEVKAIPMLDDFVDTYSNFAGTSDKYFRDQTNSLFISTDYALHLYHVLVDRSFQSIEENKFQPMLKEMSKALFLDSIKNYNSTTDAKLKDSYKRLSAYYLIPLVVLDAGSKSVPADIKQEDFNSWAQYQEAVQKREAEVQQQTFTFSLDTKSYDGQALSDEVYNLAKAELALINKAETKAPSPLFTPLRKEFENDYTQFTPRSHYTKNTILKSYFIAMMWYGRMGFPLNSRDLTRDALLITQQINNVSVDNKKVVNLWSDMMQVIDFFVGDVDDLTAYHYSKEIKDVFGNQVSSESFTDEELLTQFIDKAKVDLPAPKIVSEIVWAYDNGGQREQFLDSLKQFRFMGQRFTPDAYIINNLTQGEGAPDPETGQKLPSMPTALMTMRVLAPNNSVVQGYLNSWINDPARIKQQGRQSDKIIAKILNQLDNEFAAYNTEIWSRNIYWRWLDAFKTLLADYGKGYPYFMQTDAWQKKSLGTALGSFTELKHDTLLYAKQSYAEMGAGAPDYPELPEVVKGYVEPDLNFWNKIFSLAQITKNGLDQLGVFPEEFENKYQSYIDTVAFFRQFAADELQNKKISDDDFEKLRTINAYLKGVVSPVLNQELTAKEKRAGIVADIHTDGLQSQILYEATAKPYVIYVAVKDINGARLTRGAVFSHYEFTDKLGQRLTDEDWQAKVYDGQGSMPSGDPWILDLVK